MQCITNRVGNHENKLTLDMLMLMFLFKLVFEVRRYIIQIKMKYVTKIIQRNKKGYYMIVHNEITEA